MNEIPLEDLHLDILAKAQRGLGLTDETLFARKILSAEELTQIRSGNIETAALPRLAKALGLSPDALLASARRSWRPRPISVKGLVQFNTSFEDMTVNAYLAWDQSSGAAVAFDTGADCTGMLEYAEKHRLRIELVLLTHTHEDHIADLPRLLRSTRAQAWVHRSEHADGAQGFEAGKEFHAGALRIETRHTHGHSEGGITYVVHGLAVPVAIVGDALFAGSMGGGKVSYADALRTNALHILSLPDATVIAAGHGPLTTLDEERLHNPFIAP